MEWISIKDKLPLEGQVVDLWIFKNGTEYRETDFEYVLSLDFHKIPGFRNKSINEIVYYLEDGFVTHYMLIEKPNI